MVASFAITWNGNFSLRNTEKALYAHIKAVSFVEHLFAKT